LDGVVGWRKTNFSLPSLWQRPPPPDTRPRRRQKRRGSPVETDLGNGGPESRAGEPGADRGAHA
jgi:hypothetical protein